MRSAETKNTYSLSVEGQNQSPVLDSTLHLSRPRRELEAPWASSLRITSLASSSSALQAVSFSLSLSHTHIFVIAMADGIGSRSNHRCSGLVLLAQDILRLLDQDARRISQAIPIPPDHQPHLWSVGTGHRMATVIHCQNTVASII